MNVVGHPDATDKGRLCPGTEFAQKFTRSWRWRVVVDLVAVPLCAVVAVGEEREAEILVGASNVAGVSETRLVANRDGILGVSWIRDDEVVEPRVRSIRVFVERAVSAGVASQQGYVCGHLFAEC